MRRRVTRRPPVSARTLLTLGHHPPSGRPPARPLAYWMRRRVTRRPPVRARTLLTSAPSPAVRSLRVRENASAARSLAYLPLSILLGVAVRLAELVVVRL